MGKLRDAGWGRLSRRLAAACVACAALLLLCAVIRAADNFKDFRISREADHFRSVATEKFMDVLAVRPGMTILDIGTGTGQFAMAFAERTGRTGRVFATDIDNACLAALAKEAGRRGLDNLFPVLVDQRGVDEFYGRQTYDLITAIHVPIPGVTAFFGKMRGYLAKDGRLIVVLYRTALPFSERDFAGRFRGLAGELAAEPADSPFSRRLGESTRQLLRTNAGAEPEDALRRAIVDYFNGMLFDTGFGAEFIEGTGTGKTLAFTPAERAFADYLLVILMEEGVFLKSRPAATPKERRIAERFNKLLLLQRFRKYLHADGLFAPGLTPKIRADFERAGYRLDKEHQGVMPFEDILVFRPDGRPAARQGDDTGKTCR